MRDTCVGIAPDHLPRLFEPFSQSDSSYTRRHGGTGLGLTISRRLAGLLGGRIDVASEPGRGTTIRISLPLTTSILDGMVVGVGEQAYIIPMESIRELVERVGREPIREVLVATNPTVEGEATAHLFSQLVRRYGIGASRIAHGVPIGGEIEYVDGGTLAHALAGRLTVR